MRPGRTARGGDVNITADWIGRRGRVRPGIPHSTCITVIQGRSK